jgi:uncharacterized protein
MFIEQAVETQEPEGQRRQLMPSDVNNAVHSTWNTLAQTVLVENGRTLQDLVREMLRPMLKAWLDDNLPTLVERLVLAKIEEMTRSERRSAR